MFDFSNNFNGIFGKIKPGMCRLSMNGNIAVKTGDAGSPVYKSYNVKKGTLTNVTNFCFNVGDEMFFVIPTNKVKVGDIILVQGKPKCVKDVDKNAITVIDYESSEERKVIPERHIFMGSVYFYGKIVSMFGNSFEKGKGLANVMKMMMLSQMMGGNKNSDDSGSMGNLGQMMAMSMFMGGGNANPFEDMFDVSFDAADEDEEETDVKPTKTK